MRILVTNDDGIMAPGIEHLTKVAERFGEVTVVAPASEMSAVSHGLTLHHPLRLRKTAPGRYTVDGTPADCVYLAVHAVMDPAPDLVVSGINHGPNMGHDVFYSGTVAGAMEGVLQGVSGIAFSMVGDRYPVREHVVDWSARILERILETAPLEAPYCVNVNIPNVEGEEVRGVRATRVAERIFAPEVERRVDPRGLPYYWIGGARIPQSDGEEYDCEAVAAGYVSVSALLASREDVAGIRSLKILEETGRGAA